MKNKLYKKNNGFTLIEMVLSVSIFIIILLGATFLSKNIWTYNSIISTNFCNVTAGKNAIKKMEAEIRTASAANNGSMQ